MLDNKTKDNDSISSTEEMSTEDRAVTRALMQMAILEIRRLQEDQIVLNKRLADVTQSMHEHGKALYGDDYDSDRVG